MTYIHAIGTAVPFNTIRQDAAAGWMAEALGMNDRQHKMLNSLYASSGIETRHSVISDYSAKMGDFTFYPNAEGMEPFPTVADRMKVYRENALPLAQEAAAKALHDSNTKSSEITHLIIASCTGMYAPGLDIELVESMGFSTSVQRTLIQFMGCYAAFNALKIADHICNSDPESCILVICIELCTIHFQKGHNRDVLVSNALFSDGAAAVIIKPTPSAQPCFKIKSFFCDLAFSGKSAMAWNIANHGFEMTLSSYVPKAISSGIAGLTNNLLRKHEMQISDIRHFAIHPGGRRILEVIEESLQLNKEDNCHAYEVLRDNGNMSSATILFVLESTRKTLTGSQKGNPLLSFAFGPGLTLESMLLEVN